jgi:hypothetical protein
MELSTIATSNCALVRGGMACRLCDVDFTVQINGDPGMYGILFALGRPDENISRGWAYPPRSSAPYYFDADFMRWIVCILRKEEDYVPHFSDLPWQRSAETKCFLSDDLYIEPQGYNYDRCYIHNRFGNPNKTASKEKVTSVKTCALDEYNHGHYGVNRPFGIPVHMHCWKLWEEVSTREFGDINIEGLWDLSEKNGHQGFLSIAKFRDPMVRSNHKLVKEWNQLLVKWAHRPHTDWVTYDPCLSEVDGLDRMLSCALYSVMAKREEYEPRRLVMTSIYWRHCDNDDSSKDIQHLAWSPRYLTIGGEPAASDPFGKLPMELRHHLVRFCDVGCMANLAKASRAFRGSQGMLMDDFKVRCIQEFPWFPKLEWKISEDLMGRSQHNRVDWFHLYRIMRNLQTRPEVRNRVRMWTEFTHIARCIKDASYSTKIN